ncbi:MAG: NAD(P)-binding domain-containing protein [Gemmatimonadetes bacterium]|nr:NAD(P)-binding domain-containing protein [Gemmatimonadota bacterium]
MTTVAIVGTGNVARALGSRVVAAGGVVRFGTRDAAKARAQLDGTLATAFVGSTADAVRGADVAIVCVPAAAAVATLLGAGPLGSTVVVDATNPLRWDNGPVWNPPPEGSVSAAIAAALPGIAVVKGFNHFGVEVMENPVMAHGPADALFAADNAPAKARVMDLANRMGFVARDAGPLRNAALLENLCVLWIQLATVGGAGRQITLRVEGRG